MPPEEGVTGMRLMFKKKKKEGKGTNPGLELLCYKGHDATEQKQRPEQAGASQVSSSTHERQVPGLVGSRCTEYSLLLIHHYSCSLLLLTIPIC